MRESREKIGLSQFVERQFPNYFDLESQIDQIRNGDFDFIPQKKENFILELNKKISKGALSPLHDNSEGKWIKGYAPFCRGIIINNWTRSLNSWRKKTKDVEHLGRFNYIGRNDKELEMPEYQLEDDGTITPQKAKYLHIILYNWKQMKLENPDLEYNGIDWYIVCVKAQDVDYELPMTPITIIRNALGIEQGGSGVVINNLEYGKSVNYHKNNVRIKLLPITINKLITISTENVNSYDLCKNPLIYTSLDCPEFMKDFYEECSEYLSNKWMNLNDDEKKLRLDIEMHEIRQTRFNNFMDESQKEYGTFVDLDLVESDTESEGNPEYWTPEDWRNSTIGLVKRQGEHNELNNTLYDLGERINEALSL